MLPMTLLMLLATSLIAWVLLKPRWVKRRREQVKANAFPVAWRKILRNNVPYFYTMPADLQLQLKQHILVFLDEKAFFGFEGIQIDDEVRVTIAAQACLLLLNRETDYYPKLKSIYVYPAAFISRQQQHDQAGVLHHKARVLSGESWELGKVVLSWKDSHHGALVLNDGHNVVIHEFAHQLDQETGAANGAPFLSHQERAQWKSVFSQEFDYFHRQLSAGVPTLLDPYGATNPAEFFAVASEVFFERPQAMQQAHPELYQQLTGLYRVNPAIW